METYPIFFSFKEVIACGRFKGLIKANGRALLVFEDEKWWMHGVQPGGMSASADTPEAAFNEFSNAFGNILRDIAGETDCPNKFEKTVRKFFDTIDEEDEKVWLRSRKRIRSGKQSVPRKLGKLKKVKEECDSSISIIVADKDDIKEENIIQEEDRYSAAA